MLPTNRPDRPLSIGELARASGLSASALRFYDREGVLVPDDVDPLTGYRRYAVGQVRAARLLASLRRVGMPLAEVALVLDEDGRGASGVAADVVAAHEQRLVDGLADARAEIRRTLALLAEDADGHDARCRVTVRAGDLLEALASVRFAVAPGTPVAGAPDGSDLQVLTGILLEVTGSELRCVATDRYRMALAGIPVRRPVVGPAVPVAAVVPAAWADQVAQACAAVAAEAEVALEVGEGQVGASVAGELLATAVVPGTFPDYCPVVDPAPRAGAAGAADAADLLSRLPVEVGSVGLVVRQGTVSLAASGAGASAADVFVDPQFLREALAVAGPRPRLEVDGPRRPLAIRGDGAGFSVLMPVAPDGPDGPHA
ncbi:MerR family DNA-binding transcriptional regulator [Terrabacter sp. NPDC080008]|uniref:DNA polymerase III subunit beta family protein n=1 Tax=Terrabacter sp. NPDC080008 TaxID=3155176 RepID=UPI00344BF427